MSSYNHIFAEIAYCGMILKESTTLKENGLQQGFVVNVLQKKEKGISFGH